MEPDHASWAEHHRGLSDTRGKKVLGDKHRTSKWVSQEQLYDAAAVEASSESEAGRHFICHSY